MKSRIARADNAPDEVAARLDEAYQPWLDDLTGDQRDAIQAWQGTDRHYDELQAAFRSTDTPPDVVQDEIRDLRAAIASGALPFDIEGWKGIRSVRRTFGLSTGDLQRGVVVPYQGFFAFTIDPGVATPAFTHPPGPPVAAVLRMRWSVGAELAWIAGAGDPDMRGQYELLALPGLSLRVLEVSYPDGDEAVPEISVEVITR